MSGVVADIKPCIAIIVLITDDVVVISALPDIVTDFTVDVPLQQGNEFGHNFILAINGCG